MTLFQSNSIPGPELQAQQAAGSRFYFLMKTLRIILLSLFVTSAAYGSVAFNGLAVSELEQADASDLPAGNLTLLIVATDGADFADLPGLYDGQDLSEGASIGDGFKILHRDSSVNFGEGLSFAPGNVSFVLGDHGVAEGDSFAIVWFDGLAADAVTLGASTLGARYGTIRGADWMIPADGTYSFASEFAQVAAPAPGAFTVTLVPPDAQPDTVERPAGEALKITVASLLANDTSPEDLTVFLTSVAATSAQGAAVEHNGAWIFYTPAAEMNETDTFTYTIEDGRNVAGTGTVTVLVAEPDIPPAKNLLKLERVPETDDLSLRFAGIPGASYRIETSTDLENWTVLTTVQAGSNGVYEYIHADGFLDAQRFYRTTRD